MPHCCCRYSTRQSQKSCGRFRYMCPHEEIVAAVVSIGSSNSSIPPNVAGRYRQISVEGVEVDVIAVCKSEGGGSLGTSGKSVHACNCVGRKREFSPISSVEDSACLKANKIIGSVTSWTGSNGTYCAGSHIIVMLFMCLAIVEIPPRTPMA